MAPSRPSRQPSSRWPDRRVSYGVLVGDDPVENGAMAVTRERVLAALEGVVSRQGIRLATTGTLSEVVAGDGKVFFSITVDAADVKAWEPVRKRAEEIVRALPDVRSALVALTAERKAGAPSARPPPQSATPAPSRGESIQAVPSVDAIIAVASVDAELLKSATAATLALGLAAPGP